MPAVDILDTWEPLVAPRVRTCPGELMRQEIRETLRDFLKTTRAWQYVPAPQNIVSTQAAYTLLTPFADAEVVEAEWVQVSNPQGSGGDPSLPKTVEWLDTYIPSWRTASGDDYRYYVAEDPSTIRFPAAPVTAITGGLSYRVSLQPVQTAVTVDGTIFSKFGKEVAAGALGRLMSMVGETWANEKAALAEGAHYHREKARVQIRVRNSYSRVQQHMSAKYKFAGV